MLLLCLWHVCNGIGYCYDDHGNQLSNSPPSPELSSGGGGEFGELLLVPRPRAARLLEKSVLLRLRNVPISASG